MKRIIRILFKLLNKLDENLGPQRMRRSPKRNLHNILWERASVQSADFVEPHLGNVLIFKSKPEMWNYAAKVLTE